MLWLISTKYFPFLPYWISRIFTAIIEKKIAKQDYKNLMLQNATTLITALSWFIRIPSFLQGKMRKPTWYRDRGHIVLQFSSRETEERGLHNVSRLKIKYEPSSKLRPQTWQAITKNFSYDNQRRTTNWKVGSILLRHAPPPHRFVNINLLLHPGARAIFSHSNVLYKNI